MNHSKIENEEIIKINKLIDDKYTVLFFKDGYQKSITRCIIECKIHGLGKNFGTPWIPLLKNLKINKGGCPKCQNNYIETEKEVVERLKKEINPKYNFIGFTTKYIGKKTRCIIECNIHGNGSKWGNPWLPIVDTLFRGFGCPKCSKQYKCSVKEALENINKVNINSISFIGNFIGKNTRCNVKCSIHGDSSTWKRKWNPTYADLIQGINCIKCSGKYIHTKNEALENINFLLKNKNIKVTKFCGEYKGVYTKCEVKCDIHGNGSEWVNSWKPLLLYIKTGIKCLKCSNAYIESEKEATNNLKKIIKGKYRFINFIGKFKGDYSKCIIECNIHGEGSKWGNPWIPNYKSLKNGKNCPKCVKNYKETKEEVIDNINLLLKNKPISFNGFITPYKNSETKCNMICDIHGDGSIWEKPWNPSINTIRSKKRCPKCAIERNELSTCLKYAKQFKYGRTLYFITFKDLTRNKKFYKIGIATEEKGIKKRFINTNLKKDNIEIIKSKEIITTNINALVAEYWALRHFKKYRKYMMHVLKESHGGTECFSKDITEEMSLESIIKNSSNDFESILNDFKLTNEEKSSALIEFKKLN